MRYGANYFDGKSAKEIDALFSIENKALKIFYEDKILEYKQSEYEVSVVGKFCSIELSDGARLDVTKPDAVSILIEYSSVHNRFFSKISNKLSLISLILVLSISAIYVIFSEVVPLTASVVSKALPEETEIKIGKIIGAKVFIESKLFQDSEISKTRQIQIQDRLINLCQSDKSCPKFRLFFKRSAFFGANAFAFPGGDIVLTDAIINIAVDNDEIISVIAHEIGHVSNKHALQKILESSLRALLLVSITGDVDSIASALPSLLFESSYSRKLEIEADEFAYDFLTRHCISPNKFADLLERIGKTSVERLDTKSKLDSIISSHPGIAERSIRFREVTKSSCR
jgi:predicted Zn-dependent protease